MNELERANQLKANCEKTYTHYIDGAILYCEYVHRIYNLICDAIETPEYKASKEILDKLV